VLSDMHRYAQIAQDVHTFTLICTDIDNIKMPDHTYCKNMN